MQDPIYIRRLKYKDRNDVNCWIKSKAKSHKMNDLYFSMTIQSCSNELARQNNVVRQLKQENEQFTDQVKLLQDK